MPCVTSAFALASCASALASVAFAMVTSALYVTSSMRASSCPFFTTEQ